MKTLMTILALAVALPAAAQAPALETAAGNVRQTLKSLRQGAAEDKTDFLAAGITNIWTESDCEKVAFPAAGPNVSAPVALQSRTWVEECDNIPMPPHGGGMCIPRGRRLLTWDDATATIELAERGAPAADEVFQVCLWGRSLSLKVKKSPFKYKWTESNGRFTVTLKK